MSIDRRAQEFWSYAITRNRGRDAVAEELFSTYVMLEMNPLVLRHIGRFYGGEVARAAG